ncbi:LysR family transcriptional regulator [Candidatus Solirubrobacter pratensis]|uniref:LysR family transcriptional regulator n=1 Tax=Candidatus Solirubrobacter pratensis TaxID=1298857 RepID=UPI000687F2A6
MDVDPRFLRTFAAVARLRSFSAAARELGYTQSAVSQHIAALEADLGTALLHRRPVAPTEAGTRLLEHGGAILLRLDAARADVMRVATGPPTRLAVGATPLSARVAARAVAAARNALPPLEASLRIGTREAIATAVATGELDAGIVDGIAAVNDPLRLPETGLPAAEVAEEELAFALPPDHPLLGRGNRVRGARLEDLVDARWIDAPAVTAPLADLAMLARADGFRAALVYDGQDVAGLLALVEAGQGLALLPEKVVATGVPLASPRLVHRTELLRGGGAAALVGITAP